MGVVSVDLDNVLFDTCDALLKEIHKRIGRLFTVGDITNYLIHESLGIDAKTVYDSFNSIMTRSSSFPILPFSGAEYGTQELVKLGYVLHGATSRTPEWKEPTLDLIRLYFGDVVSKVIFTSEAGVNDGTASMINGYKSRKIKEIGAEIHIEDAIHFAEEVAEAGIPVVLVDQPWNQERSKYENKSNTGMIRRTSFWREKRQWQDIPGLVRSFK